MRVFVAYGYTDRESWVKNLVIPMLEDLGLEVLHGEVIVDSDINTGIRALIESSDALIGFLLKRENPGGQFQKNPDGSLASSVYVQQELNIAAGSRRAVIQVVETGVAPVPGMLAGTQHLKYDENSQAAFLAQLVRHVREWIRGEVYVRLSPRDLVDDLAAQGVRALTACEYDVRHQSHIERSGRSPIFPMGGSLCVKLVGFREGRSADVTVHANGKRWLKSIDYTQPVVTVELARTP